MQFVIPKFIEKEAKIVGPFTWKQVLIIGMAGGITLLLYFALPFSLFLISAILLLGGALTLAVVPIGGRTLPIVLSNLVRFGMSPKVYIWQKKPLAARPVKKPEKKQGEPTLEVAEKSMLKKLADTIETKSK